MDFKQNHSGSCKILQKLLLLKIFYTIVTKTHICFFVAVIFNIFMRQILIDYWWGLHKNMNCPFVCFLTLTLSCRRSPYCPRILFQAFPRLRHVTKKIYQREFEGGWCNIRKAYIFMKNEHSAILKIDSKVQVGSCASMWLA